MSFPSPYLLALGAWELLDNARINVLERMGLARCPSGQLDLRGQVGGWDICTLHVPYPTCDDQLHLNYTLDQARRWLIVLQACYQRCMSLTCGTISCNTGVHGDWWECGCG